MGNRQFVASVGPMSLDYEPHAANASVTFQANLPPDCNASSLNVYRLTMHVLLHDVPAMRQQCRPSGLPLAGLNIPLCAFGAPFTHYKRRGTCFDNPLALPATS